MSFTGLDSEPQEWTVVDRFQHRVLVN